MARRGNTVARSGLNLRKLVPISDQGAHPAGAGEPLMGIDDILLILILLGVILAAVATYFLWPRSEDDATPEPLPAPVIAEPQALGSAEAFRMHPAEDRGRGGDLVLLSADGRALLGLGRMAPLGEDAKPLDDPAGIAHAHACQLAVDLIARSMSVPGATIELIYHPKVRNLLAEPGVELVKVRPGDGRRAMLGALDSRKFSGYGVAIEAGRLGQVGKELEQLGRVMAAASPSQAKHVRLAIVFDAVERACKVYPL